MAPEYCPDHSELMRIAGALEQGQKDLSRDMGELKASVEDLAKQLKDSQLVNATERTKAGVFYWAIRVSGVAGVSAIVTHLYKRLCGD